MLDIKFLIENKDLVIAGAKKKHINCDVDKVIKTYENLKKLRQENEELRAEQNEVSKMIPQAPNEQKQKLIEKMGEVKEKIKTLEIQIQEAEAEYKYFAAFIPNPPFSDVPDGKDDTLNVVIESHGKIPTFNFTPKNHIELGKFHDIIDIERGAKSSGARFYYLKNEGALLEMALVQYVMHKLKSKGFIPVIPPVLVKEEAMFATGYFPADENGIYRVNPDEDNLYLVGTSEVPIAMLHSNEILLEKELPIRYVAFSSCFRREAGSYGKDTQGIIRVHQFNKVEMFSFCSPDKSEEEHQMLVEIEKEIFTELKLPFNEMLICGGDLGSPAAKKYDLEAWIPSQEKHREVTSCSNCTDFQARRLNCKYKTPEGQKEFVHTLNGTAIALPRAVVAIIENNQEADGSINIPEVLRPYMMGIAKIEKKQ